ncbi:hypothetical protein ACTMNS_11590, partial [Staphylococcus haemolyticus]
CTLVGLYKLGFNPKPNNLDRRFAFIVKRFRVFRAPLQLTNSEEMAKYVHYKLFNHKYSN